MRFLVPGGQCYQPAQVTVEGDWSQAAFFYGLNALGSQVEVTGLRSDSLQGDRVCERLLKEMTGGSLQADLSDCPDLAPVLFAVVAGLEHGAHFTGTRRLAIKESNRASAMADELAKFGAEISVGENEAKIAPVTLHRPKEDLAGSQRPSGSHGACRTGDAVWRCDRRRAGDFQELPGIFPGFGRAGRAGPHGRRSGR